MNNVVVLGRLSRDPELRTTNSGHSVTNFAIAVPRRAKKGEKAEADFFEVTAWNRQAEVINEYFHKGSRILIRGHLQQDHYTAKDGTNRSRVVIILEQLDFVDSKNNESRSNNNQQDDTNKKESSTNDTDDTSALNDDAFDEDFTLMSNDSDVPF